MQETINETVSVIASYQRETGRVMPRKIRWRDRDYLIKQLTYYHRIRAGRTLSHVFHVTDGQTDFRLRLNSDTLGWTLEEICDGQP
ncbi:hypothetical protein M1523_03240 [Patescibacteria group bacterium]|nr:hypothetical protein [Patescibacteria group bacterium]MCL5091264.1 hypothetical protein [Patescibacteria group bacterium]